MNCPLTIPLFSNNLSAVLQWIFLSSTKTLPLQQIFCYSPTDLPVFYDNHPIILIHSSSTILQQLIHNPTIDLDYSPTSVLLFGKNFSTLIE